MSAGSPRLAKRFAQMRAEGRAGLVAYVMAGDPDLETSLAIALAAAKNGADVLEFGFPFTDPMADGPPIQKAALRSLKAGTTLKKTLELVARFRAEDFDTPVILMGYANPVEQMGAADFAAAAAGAGADGAIVVDLPPEEDSVLRAELDRHELSLIRLATPTTNNTRLRMVLGGVSGFLYYVSVAGVTGAKAALADSVRAAVERIKAQTDLPLAVGFGVRTPQAAADIARVADAVVVGSAFVDEVAACVDAQRPQDAPARVAGLVSELALAVRRARDSERLS